jgi:hypothetical protein
MLVAIGNGAAQRQVAACCTACVPFPLVHDDLTR